MRIIGLEEVKSFIDLPTDLDEIYQRIKNCFIDFSKGAYTVPPPMQLALNAENGDCHAKGGFKSGGQYFAVKLVTGFYSNAQKSLPAGDGITVVFNQQTGLIEALIKDQGYLTTLRTAIACSVAASVSHEQNKSIGIVGTGQLARMVCDVMHHFYPESSIQITGRSISKAKNIADEKGYAQCVETVNELSNKTDLLLTTTASKRALIDASNLGSVKHIIASGADEDGKQELDPALFEKASLVVVDSKSQCTSFGETSYALKAKMLDSNEIIELGQVLDSNKAQTIDSSQVMITDLTGIAPQDLVMAEFVMGRVTN